MVNMSSELGEVVDGSLLEDEEGWTCVEVEGRTEKILVRDVCIPIASSDAGNDRSETGTSIDGGTVADLILWNSKCLVASSMYSPDFKRLIRRMMQQPGAKPWENVATMNPFLHQPVLDTLDAILQHSKDSDFSESTGFARAAAIKTSQAISRVSGLLPKNLILREIIQVRKKNTFGGFAIIWKGEYMSQKVCLKVPKTSGDSLKEIAKSFRQEALLWRQLHHPNILPFLGIAIDIDLGPSDELHNFCLVSPWIDNGNVNDFLKRHPAFNRLKMLLEIIEGIEYLHTHNPPIVHADIRGANILVRKNHRCLIADFGITMVIETRIPTSSRLGLGTSYWMSPEVWTHSDSYIPSRDIYAFGCTVIEIYSGKRPFPDLQNPYALLHMVVTERHKPPRPRELDDDTALWAIVDHCLSYEAGSRPTATEARHRLIAITGSTASYPLG